jgi:hypothetical protein
LDGSNLQLRPSILQYSTIKKFLRWNNSGTRLAVETWSGGQGTTMFLYDSAFAPLGNFTGGCPLWRVSDQLVFYLYGPILRGTGKVPDKIMLADQNGANAVPLLQETGWPRSCSKYDNKMLYVAGPNPDYNFSSYDIRVAYFTSKTSALVRGGFPIDNRIPNVFYTGNEMHIIFESTAGICQIRSVGTWGEKLADGKLPVILK